MGRKVIRNLNYTNIGDQDKFIDTVKFYQGPLYTLAASMEQDEKESIRRSIMVFLETHPRFCLKYSTLIFGNKK